MGVHKRGVCLCPSLSLQPKSDVSDFSQLIKRPNSGIPEFGCKRGRGRWSRRALPAARWNADVFTHVCDAFAIH